MFNKDALIELGKSFVRAAWFTFLGVVVAFLTSLLSNADLLATTWTVGSLVLPVGVWIVTGVTAAIKALDRYIHKNDDIELRGLALPPMQKEG